MTVPMVTSGRGAWTSIGKDNKSRYYEYIPGQPVDGGQPTRNVNYQAVHLGVAALQSRVNAYGYNPRLTTDGILGAKTGEGIRWVQRKLGLTPDGQAGPTTMKHIWRDFVTWFAAAYSVPAAHVWGMTALESSFDPGAVGFLTPSDRGLCQINLEAHPDITVEQAFTPDFAVDYSTRRFRNARLKYAGKGADLQTKCSIAQHNAPVYADQWYKTGSPPNTRIATYVERVLVAARTY